MKRIVVLLMVVLSVSLFAGVVSADNRDIVHSPSARGGSSK
jgi:hypothetical protein